MFENLDINWFYFLVVSYSISSKMLTYFLKVVSLLFMTRLDFSHLNDILTIIYLIGVKSNNNLVSILMLVVLTRSLDLISPGGYLFLTQIFELRCNSITVGERKLLFVSLLCYTCV